MVPTETFTSMLDEPSRGSNSSRILALRIVGWGSVRSAPRPPPTPCRQMAAPLVGLDQDVVGNHVELLLRLTLHVVAAGLAQARRPGPLRDTLTAIALTARATTSISNRRSAPISPLRCCSIRNWVSVTRRMARLSGITSESHDYRPDREPFVVYDCGLDCAKANIRPSSVSTHPKASWKSLVIGAGLAGVTSAWYLAQAGCKRHGRGPPTRPRPRNQLRQRRTGLRQPPRALGQPVGTRHRPPLAWPRGRTPALPPPRRRRNSGAGPPSFLRECLPGRTLRNTAGHRPPCRLQPPRTAVRLKTPPPAFEYASREARHPPSVPEPPATSSMSPARQAQAELEAMGIRTPNAHAGRGDRPRTGPGRTTPAPRRRSARHG
jgi:hypothetical protein